jgi:hypothetical protein
VNEINEHLRGPWLAVLSDDSGFVYPTVDDAIDTLGEEEEVDIAVVRGSAMPNDRNGTTGVLLRRPGSVMSGDVAYEIECYLVDGDSSVSAAARYAQAQAMAAGLNSAVPPAKCPNCAPGYDCESGIYTAEVFRG